MLRHGVDVDPLIIRRRHKGLLASNLGKDACRGEKRRKAKFLRRPLRYRTAAQRIPQRVSRDQTGHGQWHWKFFGHENYYGDSRRQRRRRFVQRRREHELRSALRRQGARFDQIGADSSRGARREQMVRGAAPLHRSRATTYLRVHRQSFVVWFLLQHQSRESEGVQILLGFGGAQVERQIRFSGTDEHRARWRTSVYVLSSRSRAGIY